MKNINFYNLQNIVEICLYPKRRNTRFKLYRKQGYHWWKIFGKFPLFKYYVKEDLYSFVLDHDLTKKDVLEYVPNCYIENNKVYYKPHMHIYFVGDDMTSYRGASFEKFFQTEQEMQDYCDKLVAECEKRNIQIKNIEES